MGEPEVAPLSLRGKVVIQGPAGASQSFWFLGGRFQRAESQSQRPFLPALGKAFLLDSLVLSLGWPEGMGEGMVLSPLKLSCRQTTEKQQV